jgi:hypothetical protein
VRGDVLIVATQKRAPNDPKGTRYDYGVALAVVDLFYCRTHTLLDTRHSLVAAEPGLFAWDLRNIRPVKPFAVKGRQGFYTVDDKLIEYK